MIYHCYSVTFFNKLLSILILIVLYCSCATLPEEYSKAEKLHKKGQYIEAYEHYKTALDKVISEQDRLRIENTLQRLQKTIIQDVLTRAQQIRGSQPISLNSHTDAIGILTKGLSYDDSRGLIKAKLIEYKKERGDFHDKMIRFANRADELYIDGRLSDAMAVYEEMLRLEPGNKKIKAKLEDIKRDIEQTKERYRKNIEEYLQSSNLDIAKYFMDKLANLDSNHPDIGRLRKRIDESWDQGILKSPRAIQQRKKWLQAFNTYKKRQAEPQLQGMGIKFVYSRLKDMGGKYYYEKSIKHFVAKQVYTAYGAALKAKMLEPDDIGINMVYEKCEAFLDKAVQTRVMVTPFKSLSSYGNRAISKALRDYLNTHLPYGITIINSGTKKISTNSPDILISGHRDNTETPTLTIRITDRKGSFMDNTVYVDMNTASNIDTLASQIGKKILKYIGQQEKKYYQLAHLYLEQNKTEKALRPLALGTFFCNRTSKSNEYCTSLQNLLLSASE